jgi:hypothetical protein
MDFQIEKLKEELEILYMLSDYMHKDPKYQNRCAPYSSPAAEKKWNEIHIKIVDLEEKLEEFKNLSKSSSS